MQNAIFNKDPQLPAEGATYDWTPEMIKEMKVCVKSILYFAQNFFYITTIDDGKILIKLHSCQKRILKLFKKSNRSVVLASRQIGKTTMVSIYALWIVCFNSDQRILIAANKRETAEDIIRKLQMSYRMLPNWLKPGIKSWSADGFTLENDSSITCVATSSTSARGQTFSIVILDELAFVPPNIVDDFWNSVIPVISSSMKSKIFAISTPNGTQNKFYDLYSGAERKSNGWDKERVDWWEIPGRDEEWKANMISALGSEGAFEQEYGNHFIEQHQGVNNALLDDLKVKATEPKLELDSGNYKIFHLPNNSHLYTIGVDVSEGIGRNASTIQVLDITDLGNIEQVAVYHNTEITPFNFPSKIYEVYRHWGSPPLLIERNNIGGQVIDILENTYNVENIVRYFPESNSTHIQKRTKNQRNGIFSHTNTKYIAVNNMRYWLNDLKVVKINDINTIQELETFVRFPNGSWKKQSEKDFDDRVDALYWALMILEPNITTSYYTISEFDHKGRPKQLEYDIDKDTDFEQHMEETRINSVPGHLVPVPTSFGMVPDKTPEEEMEILTENLLANGWEFVDDPHNPSEPDFSHNYWQ